MKKLLVFPALLFLSLIACAQTRLLLPCDQFNGFNDSVNTGKINKIKAKQRLRLLLGIISRSSMMMPNPGWVYPLKDYDSHAIGGTKGNGYFDKGYRYLDGNKHLAHPAHDIFINDKNQDGLDDKTHSPVDVVAVANGIIIACYNNWQPESNMRGGNFIWLYHPKLNCLTYYAHNSKIFVKPGDVVKQGDKIAEVGRTGFNAYKKRSPTHLHFSAFHVINGIPIPYNCYNQLVAAKKL